MNAWDCVEYVKIDIPDDYPIILRRDEVESWLRDNFVEYWRFWFTSMLGVVSISWELQPRKTEVCRAGLMYVYYSFPQDNCSTCDSGEIDPLHSTQDGVCNHDGSFVNVSYEILQGFVKPDTTESTLGDIMSDTTEIVESFLGEAYVK